MLGVSTLGLLGASQCRLMLITVPFWPWATKLRSKRLKPLVVQWSGTPLTRGWVCLESLTLIVPVLSYIPFPTKLVPQVSAAGTCGPASFCYTQQPEMVSTQEVPLVLASLCHLGWCLLNILKNRTANHSSEMVLYRDEMTGLLNSQDLFYL